MNRGILHYFVIFCLLLISFAGCKLITNDVPVIEISDKKNNEIPDDKEIEITVDVSAEEEPVEIEEEMELVGKNRLWTVVVYMCGDNNLESAAMTDMREMESSFLDTDEVTVLVLLDRNPAYDTSDGDWSGSRLYELKTGRKSGRDLILSKQLSCDQLSLNLERQTELNMSSPYVLSSVLKFAAEDYPAENYGLIMWGHGTGWRNENIDENEEIQMQKNYVYDSSSGESMSLKDMKFGLENFNDLYGLSFVGFDTCFGCEMEVLYELRNCTDYVIGSEGLVAASGWNYKMLFDFFDKSEKTAEDFCKIAVNQYRSYYENQSASSITAVKMDEMDDYFKKFEAYMKGFSSYMTSYEIRNNIMNRICKNLLFYSTAATKSDVYVDMKDLCTEIQSCLPSAGRNLIETGKGYYEALEKLIVSSWHFNEDSCGIGIFIGRLNDGGSFSSVYPADYIRGKSLNQISFVNDSLWYVPSKDSGEGFLDKLFFSNY